MTKWNLNTVASWFGWSSGEEMVEDLGTSPVGKWVVEQDASGNAVTQDYELLSRKMTVPVAVIGPPGSGRMEVIRAAAKLSGTSAYVHEDFQERYEAQKIFGVHLGDIFSILGTFLVYLFSFVGGFFAGDIIKKINRKK